jgi:ribosomal protein L4
MNGDDPLQRAQIAQLQDQQRLLASRMRRLAVALALTEDAIAEVLHNAGGAEPDADVRTSAARAVVNAATCRDIASRISRAYGDNP